MVVTPISFQKDTDDFAKIFNQQKLKTKQLTQKFQALEDNTAIQNEQDMRLPQMVPLDKLTYNGKNKQQYEKEAIAQINQATLQGITNGENASRKLHSEAKNQTEEKTAEAISKLKDKFDATKTQVLAIVNNFGKIRSDLQELKNEYI